MMQITLEKFTKQSDVAECQDYQKIIQRISCVAKYEEFDKAMCYLMEHLKNTDKRVQDAALEALTNMLYSDEFDYINDIRVESMLPILFENLKQTDAYDTEMLLFDIIYLMPKFASKIYRECFANGKAAFFKATPKILQKYDKNDLYVYKSIKEKKEFIQRFFYHSPNYDEILELCLSIIDNIDNESLYEEALMGIITLVRRFEKIDFDRVMLSVDKFTIIDDDEGARDDHEEFKYMNEHGWVNTLLIDIVVLIPSLRERSREIYNKRTSGSCWEGRYGPKI